MIRKCLSVGMMLPALDLEPLSWIRVELLGVAASVFWTRIREYLTCPLQTGPES
jgi:hypothetical protein